MIAKIAVVAIHNNVFCYSSDTCSVAKGSTIFLWEMSWAQTTPKGRPKNLYLPSSGNKSARIGVKFEVLFKLNCFDKNGLETLG